MAEVLSIEGLSVKLSKRTILEDVTLSVPKGRFVALVGPNGSGKTTLIKTLYRSVAATGRIVIDGQDLERYDQRSLAQKIAVLPQEMELAFDFTVRELVLLGRSPYKRLFEPDTAEDLSVVERSLKMTGALALIERRFLSLSGGEKQRVLLARALAQSPTLLVLDEPTNHLDIKHRLEVLQLIKTLDLTVLAALHDLNLAHTFADEVVVLDRGRVIESGPAPAVLQSALIERVFGVRTEKLHSKNGPVLAFSARRAP